MGNDRDSSKAWLGLASDYEMARAKEDSLDRLVEWPAQRDLLGDVTPDGRCSILVAATVPSSLSLLEMVRPPL